MLEFVLQLAAYYRASVLVPQAVQLPGYLPVQPVDIFQVQGIVGAYVQGFGENPVGNASVAYLSVAEGTYAHDYGHVMLRAELHETAQIPVAAPVELTFVLLVNGPENIGRDHGDASSLDLENLVLPLLRGVAAEMELPEHGNHGPAVD